MHVELLAYAAQVLADSSPDPNAVKVAVLSLTGVVVASAASVLVTLRSPREHRPSPRVGRRVGQSDQRYVRTLTRRLAEVERERDAARAELATVKGRKSAYERFLWLHHFDPAKILTGDERVDDARI